MTLQKDWKFELWAYLFNSIVELDNDNSYDCFSIEVIHGMNMTRPKSVEEFIISKNLTEEKYQSLNKIDIFNEYLVFIKFTKPFGFIVEKDINLNYQKMFYNAGIQTDKDLNKETLIKLCINICLNQEPKHICSSSVYAIGKAYLQTVNQLPQTEKTLSYTELEYCNEKNGCISSKYSFKEIINTIEGCGWLSRYLGYE